MLKAGSKSNNSLTFCSVMGKQRQPCSLWSVLPLWVIFPIVLSVSSAASAVTKVAFVADQGVSSNAQAVLSLIKEEGTDIVLIQGDLGYNNETAIKWERNLTDFLGADFPVLTLAGNHEWREWPLYERFINCLLYTSPSPRDRQKSRMPSSA